MTRIKLKATPGSHTVESVEDGGIVVEWYDFGDHAPYESANMLIFGADGLPLLAAALGLAAESSADAILTALAERFESYFAIRAFADARAAPYRHEVDFQP